MNQPVRLPMREKQNMFLGNPHTIRKRPYSPHPMNSSRNHRHPPPQLKRGNFGHIGNNKRPPAGFHPMFSRRQEKPPHYTNNFGFKQSRNAPRCKLPFRNIRSSTKLHPNIGSVSGRGRPHLQTGIRNVLTKASAGMFTKNGRY